MTWKHWQLAATLSSGLIADKHASARSLPPLLFLTDNKRTPDPVAAIAKLPQNCAVIFRHYEAQDRAALGADCRQAAAAYGHPFLVAGDYELARDLKADGMHLPEYMTPQARRVRQRQPDWRITLAVHSPLAVCRAHPLDVDALLASPVFPTQSHTAQAAVGALRLARWCQLGRHQVYALGGVQQNTLLRLKGTGIDGIAAIGALLES